MYKNAILYATFIWPNCSWSCFPKTDFHLPQLLGCWCTAKQNYTCLNPFSRFVNVMCGSLSRRIPISVGCFDQTRSEMISSIFKTPTAEEPWTFFCGLDWGVYRYCSAHRWGLRYAELPLQVWLTGVCTMFALTSWCLTFYWIMPLVQSHLSRQEH